MEWPKELTVYKNHHMDSTTWDGFKFRDDDIIVGSWAKSGTTLTQQLIGQLISHGDPNFVSNDESPWWDLRFLPAEAREAVEKQTHRRFLKTHLPATALPYDPRVKYICCYRDGRDVAWSMHHHHASVTDLWYQLVNDTPGRVGPAMPPCNPDQRQYFLDWLRGDGQPWWPFFSHVQSWWNVRHLPNVMLVHFNALITDLPSEARRIAAFLGISVPEDKWPVILEHCSKDWMRANPDKIGSMFGAFWQGGIKDFIFKGTNGRWADTLTAEDCAEYEAKAKQELGADCATWLGGKGPLDAKAYPAK
ncbi:hypothetical protein HYH03_016582 [Edaphochlamys debaryana]|uniref:Sulfotransferase n=1 Tax=Edaphochlamys debaryana TaxID=47281 RepID=A0A835XKT2_9CHLO|nr:hypothetical protein HYH03_016582 [Edaphochlamys debaryana]|eukprot:KAG2484628.1 hypothetical protein HYH03_016582 [Edaphochlamys debaryana]